MILATAEANLLRPFDGVDTVLLVDAAEVVGGIVGVLLNCVIRGVGHSSIGFFDRVIACLK